MGVLDCEEVLWFYGATFEVKSFACNLGTPQLSVFAAPHLVNCFKEDTKFAKITFTVEQRRKISLSGGLEQGDR